MALPTAHILEYHQLLSFHVVFSSYRHFRKAQHLPDNSKVKSWGKGILDLNFDSRNCVIRNGENTILMQPFSEFRAIAADKIDQLLTLTFNSDEWDIISQNVAEAACIMHLAQYIGKSHIFTAAEVARAGLQKGVLGLEQTRVFKQGLVQELDNDGRKVRVRFFIVVPGKVFGFQRQEEAVGHPASFVTSLFNARVTTVGEVPGFQLHVDRMEPLYFDTLQEDERPSWITELNASIEVTRDTINGFLVTARPTRRTSKVQREDTNQDAHQCPGISASSSSNQEGSTIPCTNQKAALDLSQEPPTGSETHEDDLSSKQTHVVASAKSKPLSGARIFLEDSLTELRILVSHVQAASNVLHDLRLFTSSTSSVRGKKYSSPVTLQWPSAGNERSWPHRDSQRRYLYDSSYADLLMQRDFPSSSKSEPPDIVFDTSDLTKPTQETASSGRQQKNMEFQLPTSNQDRSTTTTGEQGKVQANRNSLYKSTKSLSLDAQNLYAEEADAIPTNVMQKSIKEQVCTLDAPEDFIEAPYIERNSQSVSLSYIGTEKDSRSTAFQQLSAAPGTDSMQNEMGTLKSSMLKPILSRQASAQASRAVAFMTEPEISSLSDSAPSSQVEAQPQASAVMRRASDETTRVQNSGSVRPLASQPRASQTEFPLTVYEPPVGQDLPQQYQNSASLTMRPSQQFSARKSNVQASGYAQAQQSAKLDLITEGNREGDFEMAKTSARRY